MTMKRKLTVVLTLTVLGLPLTAMASDLECFPLCADPAKVDANMNATLATIEVVSGRNAVEANALSACDSGFMKSAEEFGDSVKPIKDLVGYVRSPQGLAIKLVNDHIVKIPAWIGYAMDPLGSIKRQAMGEARTLARDAMSDGSGCEVSPVEISVDLASTIEAIEAVDAKHSI
jgi:hypothetical protein